MGISSDWLFYSRAEIAPLAERIAALNKDVTFVELESPNGHDAFLKDWDELTGIVKPFIDRALADVERP
jgi:homoserine O-acetyltransferase